MSTSRILLVILAVCALSALAFIVAQSRPNEPAAGREEAHVTVETRIDEGASALDVKVIPIDVLEDSRCPIGVTCVWEGRVRVRAQIVSGLGTSTNEFEIGTTITTEAEEVTLIAADPAPRENVVLDENDYVFTFRVAKRVI